MWEPRKDNSRYLVLNEIINIIESAAPLKWQEAWDNSGLQVGNRNAEIHAALLTTDVTEAVVREAIMLHCDLIVSHHPLLFHGLKSICGVTPQERCVQLAIKNDIAIYSSHTSMDSWLHGVSGKMAEQLGITDYHILVPSADDYGLGVIGILPEAMPFTNLLKRVKEAFGAERLRYIEPVRQEVKTVALCGGAGAEFADEAVRQGADVYISADFKYHEMLQADGRIGVIDMDHWVSEHFTRNIFAELLQGKVATYISRADRTPIQFI